MKNSIKILAGFALLSVVFMGCPYESEVPIDKPLIKVNENFLTKWEKKSSDTYDYKVSKVDMYTYKILEIKRETKEVSDRYYGYFSKIGETDMFNMYKVDTDGNRTGKYMIYKAVISATGSRVTLVEMTENVDEQFESSMELKNFIKANMNNSYFWDKDEEVYLMSE
jgi:hypothetical protein